MKSRMLLLLTVMTLSVLPACAGVGQSAVTTLVFPYGARSYAMGEVGTALADDESVLFYNPAGLDVPNDRWAGGSGSLFYERPLPALKTTDLWHTAIAADIQDTSFLWFQPGVFLNFVNMGLDGFTDEQGIERGSVQRYEEVMALGCGFDLKDIGIDNHYFGLTAKFVNSVLAPGIGSSGAGGGKTYAFDFGYLWTIGPAWRFGATLMNMGRSIYYVSEENRDPIPFTLNLAIGYKHHFDLNESPFLDIAGEFRLDREIVNSDGHNPDPFYKAIWTDFLHDTSDSTFGDWMMRFNEHLGAEATFCKTASLRGGYLIDLMGERYELHWGLGLNLFNHFSLDWGYIIAPERFMKGFTRMFDPNKSGATGARDKQWQISLTATRLLKWDESDFFRYLAKKPR